MNLLYYWCLRGMDEEQREQFLAILESPLDWQKPDKPTDRQVVQEAQDFMNFMGAMNGQ